MKNELPKRKNIRIPEYDYSQNGYYFITICTQNRCKILSNIVGVGEQQHIEAVTHICSNSHNILDDPLHKHTENQIQNCRGGPCVRPPQKEYPKEIMPESVKLNLTNIGNLVKANYLNIEKEFKNVKLHDYVIMPNHMHGIIEITERADTGPAPTIPNIICSFKTRTTHEISIGIKEGKYEPYQKRFWQRNYYEHVIRNEKEYLRILEYIEYNPLNWIYDKYY